MSKDEHEDAGSHFKDLSRELWKDKGKEKKSAIDLTRGPGSAIGRAVLTGAAASAVSGAVGAAKGHGSSNSSALGGAARGMGGSALGGALGLVAGAGAIAGLVATGSNNKSLGALTHYGLPLAALAGASVGQHLATKGIKKSAMIDGLIDELAKIGMNLPPMHPRGTNAGVRTPAAAPGKPAAAQTGPTPAAPKFTGTLPPMHPKAKIASSEKDSGFLGDLAAKAKNVALTDVGGPKGLLTPIGQAKANATPKLKKPGADFAAWQAKRALRPSVA